MRGGGTGGRVDCGGDVQLSRGWGGQRMKGNLVARVAEVMLHLYAASAAVHVRGHAWRQPPQAAASALTATAS